MMAVDEPASPASSHQVTPLDISPETTSQTLSQDEPATDDQHTNHRLSVPDQHCNNSANGQIPSLSISQSDIPLNHDINGTAALYQPCNGTKCTSSTSAPLLAVMGTAATASPALRRYLRPESEYRCSHSSLAKSCSYRDLDLNEIHPIPQEKVSMTWRQKIKMTRNIYVISVSFMLVFSAFNAMQNLASSLLEEDSLGVISLSCVYAFSIVSCFLSPCIVKLCTPKWTQVAAFVTGSLFVGCMLYPKLYTLLPGSVLWGLFNGPLWTAAGLYVTTAGMNYGVAVQGSVPGYISQFTGIWMMFQQMSQIIGNVISSLVLKSEVGLSERELGRACGAAYDIDYYNETLNATETIDHGNALFVLGAIYISFALAGAIITAIFLTPFRHCETQMDYGSVVSFVDVLTDRLSGKQLLVSTLYLIRNPKMYLVIPLSYVVGMQMTYLFADFTQAFVGCGLGVNYIGLTMIAFGVANAVGCYLGGRLYNIVGRLCLFTMAFLINLALYVTLLLWTPADGYVLYFVVPTLWGIADAIYQPQTMAFLGYLFPVRQEIAYANYNLFKNLGMAVTFAYSGRLSIPYKLYLAMGLTVVAIVAYYTLEWRIRRGGTSRRRKKEQLDEMTKKDEEENLKTVDAADV